MLKRLPLIALLVLVASACSGAPAGLTQQPGTTQQPGGGNVAPGTDTCALLTAADMKAIWGTDLTPVSDADGACTWGTISTRFEATDLSTAKAILGNEADVTVAGRPGVIGTLFGVILYVQVGNVDLVVQTVLTTDNPETRQKVIQTAERALARIR